ADGMPLRDAPNIAPVVPIRKVLRFMSAPWFRFRYRVNGQVTHWPREAVTGTVSHLLRVSLMAQQTVITNL
ncbi:hypothetical protein LAV84_27250, partial [Rhizobium sp. VS19-DR104.2]|uniref:hypothetical protein n=1 Tax=Rhizobium sp. VS19-DR104.2 TaxID=2875954 RepID=UPI001CCBF5F6